MPDRSNHHGTCHCCCLRSQHSFPKTFLSCCLRSQHSRHANNGNINRPLPIKVVLICLLKQLYLEAAMTTVVKEMLRAILLLLLSLFNLMQWRSAMLGHHKCSVITNHGDATLVLLVAVSVFGNMGVFGHMGETNS